MLKKAVFLFLLGLFTGTLSGTEFPADLTEKWYFSIKDKKINKIKYSKDGCNGDGAMVFINGKDGWNLFAGRRKSFSVKEGDSIIISTMLKGTGRAAVFISFYDRNGKAVINKSTLRHKYQFAEKEWKVMEIKTRAPKDAVKFTLTFRSIGGAGEIAISSLKIKVESGLILKNDKMTITFNPVYGAMIQSFLLAENGFDFTHKDTQRTPGGLFRDVVPAKEMPGVFSKEFFTHKVLEAGQKIRFTRMTEKGPLRGLQLEKEYSLAPNSTELKLTATFTNTRKNSLTTSYRVHNILSNANGTFSWPLNDWVQIFRYDSSDPYGIYKLTANPIRSGWFARTYEKIGKTLLFQFNLPQAEKGFTYLTKKLNTMELYCREFTLEPGEKRKFHFTLSIIPSGKKDYYTDEANQKQPVQKIALKKLPKVPEKTTVLPEKYRNTFPFTVRLGHPVKGVRSGGKGNFTKDLIFANTRAAIDNYCNGVYSWNIGFFSKLNTGDGKNIYGEMLRRLDATYGEINHICQKTDIDITPEWIRKVRKRFQKLQDKDVQKFMKDYSDRLLCIYSADEIEGHNAETMLYLHNEASKLLPKDVLIFPYLMITGEPLIPYLPVFVLDSYPIHKDQYGGRDPWKIYNTFRKIVEKAGPEKPVWFMPQGFGGGGYIMPNDAEMRLMLNLSVAAGVKGIVFYGIMSHGWPWVYKGYDDISAFGAAGQYTSCWESIGKVAKQLGAVGSLLARSTPANVPADIKVSTKTFNSDKFNTVKQLYRGPAVGIDALKSQEGLLLILVNRNIYENETAEISFGKHNVLDVEKMQVISGKSTVKLLPGEARYYFMGQIPRAAEEIWQGMFIRERARYRLFLDQAAANGIIHKEPDFAKLSPEKAYKALTADFAALRKKVEASSYGKTLRLLQEVQKELNSIDELFVKNLDIVVSPAMGKKGRYYPPHEDKEVQKSRDAIYKAFFQWNSFHNSIAAGDAGKIAEALEKFAVQTRQDCREARNMIEKRLPGKK